MSKVEAGALFGRLTVTEHINSSAVTCACTCGNIVTTQASNLRAGKTQSCGCLRKERNNHTSHGGTGSLTHKRWRAMRARCLNKNASNYPAYGGSGITISARWNDYANFLADMGECPSPDMTIERGDNTKGYGPENCRWATRIEQARNQSTNRLLTYQGKTLNVSAWAEALGIKAQTILNRLRSGWSIEEALSATGDARSSRREKP